MIAALTRARTWFPVSSRASRYVPSTASPAPSAIAKVGVPNTISPAASTSGQPGVYWEKYIPSCTPVSHGWKNCGAPPPDVKICPDRSARTVQRYTGSSRFHEYAG